MQQGLSLTNLKLTQKMTANIMNQVIISEYTYFLEIFVYLEI
jgi:hypothetical protein